jgi:hypothetical protein
MTKIAKITLEEDMEKIEAKILKTKTLKREKTTKAKKSR